MQLLFIAHVRVFAAELDQHRLGFGKSPGEAWRKSHELLPRSLANLAWSFASCAMYHQPLIDLISCRAIKLKQEFTS